MDQQRARKNGTYTEKKSEIIKFRK